MTQYASNFDEFVKKSLEAIRTNLNETETGHELSDDLLRETLRKNPNTTPEEWEKIKQDFLTFCFFTAVQGCPEAMHELGTHVYNELNGGNEND